MAAAMLYVAGSRVEPIRADDRDWHVGLNLRSDIGTHSVRFDGGVRLGTLDLILVLDPMIWIDGQCDVDVIAQLLLGDSGWGLTAGWRPSSIALDDDRQFQEKALVGVVAELPVLAGGRIRAQWGAELSLLLVKHGGGLPADYLSLASGRDVQDNLTTGMFLRISHAANF
jgi:hypothetical protein